MLRIIRSAAYRISFAYALAFAIATLVLGIAVVMVAHAAFMHQLEGQITEDSGALVAEYNLEGHGGLAFAISEREKGDTTNELLYAVFSPQGARIQGALQAKRPPVGWSDMPFQDPLEGPDTARALGIDLRDGSRLVVAADSSVVERVDSTLITIFAGAFAAVLVVSIGGALLLGHYLQRRLSAISMAANRIMSGDLARRIPVSVRHDEFDDLAASLNRMLDRIADLLDNLRQVSSDVAHDLRTPLARLRNSLEDGLGGLNDKAHVEAVLRSAITQSDTILSLFSALLRISEVESGKLNRTFQPFDISLLLDELWESYQPVIEESGRRLSGVIERPLQIRGDRELIAQLVINLLANAQNYTPPGTEIHLALAGAGGAVRIAVSDNGPGIPPQDRERVLRRFVRLENGRSTPGNGLGLSIAAAIAHAHGATIMLGDNRPGLIVTVELPASLD
jgi:signal transduction histidine kinase